MKCLMSPQSKSPCTDFLRANGTAPPVPVLANTPSSSKKRPAQTDPEITTTGDSEGDLRALQKVEVRLHLKGFPCLI